MRRIFLTTAFTVIFSTSAMAGEIPTVGFVPPQPPPPAALQAGTSPEKSLQCSRIILVLT